MRLEAALGFRSTACSTWPNTRSTPIFGSTAVKNMTIIWCFYHSNISITICNIGKNRIDLPFKNGFWQNPQNRNEPGAEVDWNGGVADCMFPDVVSRLLRGSYYLVDELDFSFLSFRLGEGMDRGEEWWQIDGTRHRNKVAAAGVIWLHSLYYH